VELAAFGVAAGAFVLALIFTPLVRAAALKLNFVDKPGERKIHDREIAYGGGIAVAISVALIVFAAVPLLKEHLPRPATDDLALKTILVVAAGSFGALLLGLYDDKMKLSPYAKLAGQLVLAIGAVAGGVRITALVGDNLLMQAVTVLWIVLITNSFNLLDNMDGLCSGTVAIAAGVLAIVTIDSGQWTLALGLSALGGACFGFLRFNRAPASIFLGDAGSLFVGFLMACFTVLATYYRYREPSHLAVGIPILVLAIPLYDTLSVIVIRLREKRPIMRGDTSHFSHRLVDLGMTRRQAVMTIHLACLAIGLPATVLGQLSEPRGFLIIGQAVLVLTIVALLEHAGRTRAREMKSAAASSGPAPSVDAAHSRETAASTRPEDPA